MKNQESNTEHPYPVAADYKTRVAYFSMEFGIHQALKTYSGGLGYLAGSHMRSVYDLKQNVIGIGMLWKYGYYDQKRRNARSMETRFLKKYYHFLQETDIIVPVYIDRSLVYVKALYLAPEVFGTAPMYFLTTDIPENDYLARTITHKLYDSEEPARIAQSIVLGIGGAKVVDALGGVDIYHMNEGHALPLAFHLYGKSHDVEKVREQMVFTTHTPERAGNEEHNINVLEKMGFFAYLPIDQVRRITGVHDDNFGYTPVALRLAKLSNGVSKLHGVVAREMWENIEGKCDIIHITNAQNKKFWADKIIDKAAHADDNEAMVLRKKELKRQLFDLIADRTGKLFDPEVLTIVWARRFAGYKRADLLMRDAERFEALINNSDRPVQIIWAGKPYPTDRFAVDLFNTIMERVEKIKNCVCLAGYELQLSRLLKTGSDVWLNNPRLYREASGTSGMTASMNGSVNLSIQDGWVPEYGEHGVNSFLLPMIPSPEMPLNEQDDFDGKNLMDILENEVVPMYYDKPEKWAEMMKTNIKTVSPQFDSDRMADEYYKLMYNS